MSKCPHPHFQHLIQDGHGVKDVGDNGAVDAEGHGGVEDAGVGGVEDAGDGVVKWRMRAAGSVEDEGRCL